MLDEAFDKPLAYSRSKTEEKSLERMMPQSVSYYEIYDAKLGSDNIRFYLLLVGGEHYELHFSNSANQYDPITVFGARYKRNQLTRIIATGIDIAVSKMRTKTTPFLVYGSDKRKTDLFKKAILSKMPNALIKSVENVKAVDGSTYPNGFYVTRDTRTLKLEQIVKHILKGE